MLVDVLTYDDVSSALFDWVLTVEQEEQERQVTPRGKGERDHPGSFVYPAAGCRSYANFWGVAKKKARGPISRRRNCKRSGAVELNERTNDEEMPVDLQLTCQAAFKRPQSKICRLPNISRD